MCEVCSGVFWPDSACVGVFEQCPCNYGCADLEQSLPSRALCACGRFKGQGARGKGQERAVLAGGTGVGSADVGAPRRRRVRQPWMWIRTAVVCCLRGGYALPCVGSAG